MNMQAISFASVALLALGCSGRSSNATTDLPSQWTTAQSVKSFSQATCDRFAPDGGAGPEAIDVTATVGSIHVAYHHANFRCEQSVEGFVRMSDPGWDLGRATTAVTEIKE